MLMDNGKLTLGGYIVSGTWNNVTGGAVGLHAFSKGTLNPLAVVGSGSNAVLVIADVRAGTFETLENYIKRVAGAGGGGSLPTRDPYDVPAAKRIEVVDANVPAYLETNTAYYGCEFVDEVRGAGKPTCYKCRPSAPALTGGATVWKWFRIDIL